MSLTESIRNRHLHTLLHLRWPLNKVSLQIPPSYKFSLFSPLFWRRFSVAADVKPIELEFPESPCRKDKKALSVFFRESIGVLDKTDTSEADDQTVGERAELIGKLKNLEEEVKSMSNKHASGKGKVLNLNRETNKRISLWGLFADEKKKEEIKVVERLCFGNEDPAIHKRFSSDMQGFVFLLFQKGYFKDSNFMSNNSFDLSKLESSYARNFVKFAAVKFGGDHQEIARWLSGTDIKELALFGCPSLGERTVFAAKRLRSFFEIEEHEVCRKCRLSDSCRLKNVVMKDASELRLCDVTRILVMYAMGSVPPKLVVLERINNCVSRLLKEVINLCQTF